MDRCNIMILFLFKLLYIYVTINPVESLGLSISSFDIPEELGNFPNCTDCNVKPGPSCFCLESNVDDKCLICCTNKPLCCYCHKCTPCWNGEWQFMTITHISISLLFVLGVLALIIIYFKICSRTRQVMQERCILVQDGHDLTTQCSTIEGLRDRPPPYSEVYGAPPLYTSPCNRVSMQEAPPVYSGPAKTQERSQEPSDVIESSIMRHM